MTTVTDNTLHTWKLLNFKILSILNTKWQICEAIHMLIRWIWPFHSIYIYITLYIYIKKHVVYHKYSFNLLIKIIYKIKCCKHTKIIMCHYNICETPFLTRNHELVQQSEAKQYKIENFNYSRQLGCLIA